MIDVVLVNYNNADQIIQYVARVATFAIIDRIVIVDNASSDGSFNRLRELPLKKTEVISSGRNGGYGFGNNFGIQYLSANYQTKYALISNADVYYDEPFLSALLSNLIESSASVSAGLMTSPTGDLTFPWAIPEGWQYVTNACFGISKISKKYSYDERYIKQTERPFVEVECVPGSLLLVKVDDFLSVGGYDEDIFLYCEETVLGIRMRELAYKTIVSPTAVFIHDHPRTRDGFVKMQKLMWESRILVLKKYYNFGVVDINLVRLLSWMSNSLYALRTSITQMLGER